MEADTKTEDREWDTERELRLTIYDTPEQGYALVLEGGTSGFRIGGPKLYGQQTEVASWSLDERARREIVERLRVERSEPGRMQVKPGAPLPDDCTCRGVVRTTEGGLLVVASETWCPVHQMRRLRQSDPGGEPPYYRGYRPEHWLEIARDELARRAVKHTSDGRPNEAKKCREARSYLLTLLEHPAAPTDEAPEGERQRTVGCEDEDGLLITHPESETCEVCAPPVEEGERGALSEDEIEALNVAGELVGHFVDGGRVDPWGWDVDWGRIDGILHDLRRRLISAPDAREGEGGGERDALADWSLALAGYVENYLDGEGLNRTAMRMTIDKVREAADRAPQGEVDPDDPRCPHCNSRVQVVSDDGKLYLAPDPAEHDGAPQREGERGEVDWHRIGETYSQESVEGCGWKFASWEAGFNAAIREVRARLRSTPQGGTDAD